jgi:DNA repair photolyase
MRTIYEPESRAREFSELALNLYTTCNMGCSYCFNKKMPWYKDIQCRPRTGVLDDLEKRAKQIAGDQREILLCFTCDPYPVLPQSKIITREALLILEHYGLRAQILTKAGMRSTQDSDILKRNWWKYGCSLTCSSEETRLEYEPFTAPFKERLEAMVSMKTQGIYTWVSLEPVLDPVESLWIIKHLLLTARTRPDYWKLGKLNYEQTGTDWKRYLEQARKLLDDNNQQYMVKADLLEAGK